MINWMKRLALISVGVVLGVSGFMTYGLLFNNDEELTTESLFEFVSPRVQTESSADILLDFSVLRTTLEAYIEESGYDAALYFEYLPNGTSFEAGSSDTKYKSASLNKVSMALNVYAMAEAGQYNLDDVVTLQADDLDNTYGDLYKEGEGYSMTIRQATRIMLTESDNTAYNALTRIFIENLPEDTSGLSASNELDSFYEVIPDEVRGGNIGLITARSYSKFFKCLYYSCLLSVEHSNELLEYLASSNYDLRLTQPIPISVAVAHKYGVYYDETQNDCGIVYLENRNYVLCVMMNGTVQQGNELIQLLSEITYTYVRDQNPISNTLQ